MSNHRIHLPQGACQCRSQGLPREHSFLWQGNCPSHTSIEAFDSAHTQSSSIKALQCQPTLTACTALCRHGAATQLPSAGQLMVVHDMTGHIPACVIIASLETHSVFKHRKQCRGQAEHLFWSLPELLRWASSRATLAAVAAMLSYLCCRSGQMSASC